jgi:hypothetical protein
MDNQPARVDERAVVQGLRMPQAAALVAIVMNLVAVFGSAWLALGPILGLVEKPYGWALPLQVGLPWLGVAMVWRFPKWYSLFHGLTGRFLALQRGEKCLDLIAFFFPTFLTIAAYYQYMHLVRWAPAIPWACALGGLLFLAGGLPDRELWARNMGRRLDLVFAMILSFSYGCAAVMQLNCLLDHSLDVVSTSIVTTKSDRGRGWHLQVSPWGPQRESKTVAVPYELFQAIQPGEKVCMVQRGGALGIAWYTVQACPWKGGPLFFEAGGRL